MVNINYSYPNSTKKILNNLNVEIEIDGGVNFETGQKCVEAGAHVLVAGSFLFNQGDLIKATNTLSEKFN